MYISFVASLKERTSCLKSESRRVVEHCEDWGWVDVHETSEGGAIVIMGDLDNYLETLEKLDIKMKELGKKVEMDVNPRGTGFVLVDQDENQVPFDMIMSALFD